MTHDCSPDKFEWTQYLALIWKPPPHAIERIPGYIKGFSRRFAQSSHDHRGTNESPGRVVTLVSAEEWHKLPHADSISDGDTVWGVVYRIDPQYIQEVKTYLDHREKDGYTCQEVDVFDHRDGSERLLMRKIKVYVGRFDNPSFTGPEQLDDLAAVIHRSIGPSGKNSEYLYNLVDAVSKLCPDSQDAYLEELNRRVRALDHP